MKKLLLAASVITICSIAFLLLKKSTVENKAVFIHENEAEKGGVDKALEQDFDRIKDLSTNTIPLERLWQAKLLKDQRMAQRPVAAVPAINWTERGPSNVAGRTRSVLFDLNDMANGYNKVWAGAVGGGLWYTNDITATIPVWTKVNDFLDNIAITCITQNPLNPQEMYFGTGEGWFNADAIQGLGIWKSSDGGVNWARLASTANFNYVNDLLIDKNGYLYAAVRERQNAAKGILRSTDGGASWTQVLGAGITTGAIYGADLELAANGDIYASLGTINTTGGIFTSSFSTHATNTGALGNWTDITPNSAGTITSAGNWWRIELACAPSNANVVYALFEGVSNNNCTSIQSYSLATNRWTVKTIPTIIDQGNNPNFTRGQAWYDLTATVDPNDSLALYIGGVDALRSNDGGNSWTQMSTWSLFNATGFTSAQNVHADHHALVYSPGSSSRAIIASDGGVAYSINADRVGGKPTFVSKNNGFNVTQFYATAIHPVGGTNYFLCGAQDNGTQKFTTAGMNATTDASGGDGAFCHIDQNNANVQITSFIYNNYYISTNGGTSFATRSFSNNGSFINPTDYDNLTQVLYGGGVTTGTISYFRWNNPATGGSNTNFVTVPQFSGSFITHVKVSPHTPNRVYFGLRNGSIVQVDDANTGTSKTGKIISNSFTTGSISCIEIDPADEAHMLVTVSNYGITSVFESKNATAVSPTFMAVEGNLPDMPVRWAMFDPRNADWALVATELGVWSTDNINGSSTDWQPTNTGLANVRVDMLKYRPSDRTIAAATHGRGLFTAIVPATTTPDINFATALAAGLEQTAATEACKGYKDYSVQMTISNAPTGDATVQLSVDAASTATSGDDYEITTNGDFATPSSSLVFASGATATKTVSIRVYNDAEIENSEKIKIVYNISGTTNAIRGTSFQTFTLSIGDNDNLPTADGAGTFITGTSGGSVFNQTPFRSDKLKHRLQALYSAADLRASGFLGSGNITALQVFVTSPNERLFNGFTISLANTTANSLTNYITSPLTQVYSANYTTIPAGQFNAPTANTFTFTAPFLWDGVSSIVVQFCFEGGPNLTSTSYSVESNNAPFGTGVRSTCYSNYSSGSTAGCSLTAAFVDDSRPRAAFIGSFSGTAIATALNTSITNALGANREIYYYTPANELMAKIKNLGTHDYKCTEAVIDRAGTGVSQFWNTNTANYLMNKTFRIVPAINNITGSYEVTFYFTKEEVEGWQTATGQSFNNIQVIKIPSQIKNVTPATPEPDGAGTVQIITPVRGTLGTRYTLTATFTNGFSGFGFGVPSSSLPVSLLSFTGRLQDNHSYLDWSTSTEQNSRLFEVQKSGDGISYTPIGNVNAAGNSNTKVSYRFYDKAFALDRNYYRLNMIDNDGKSKLSNVVIIRNIKDAQGITVLNNPFVNYIDIRFQKTLSSKIQLRLTDLSGKEVLTSEITNPAQQIRWNTSGKQINKGIYLLTVFADGKQYAAKVMKQ